MIYNSKNPPRIFRVGSNNDIEISDCGTIALDANELVTFITPGGGEYDVVRKEFGFYATPSLNSRLPSFGLRPALVKNAKSQFYIFLVEKGFENEFEVYCRTEKQNVILFLDDDISLKKFEVFFHSIRCSEKNTANLICPVCRKTLLECVHIYEERPLGETKFKIQEGIKYEREIWKCSNCSHFVSRYNLDLNDLYSNDYVNSTYGGSDGIRKNFERIMNLSPEKSDNVGRVERVVEFIETFFPNNNSVNLLDIGSGLGVFLALIMKNKDWDCVALEPDFRFSQHIREQLNLETLCGDFNQIEIDQKFELITLNKVLEHIQNPLNILKKCSQTITSDGFIYIEVPDGEVAMLDELSFEREEFFVEHPHIFSMTSLVLLIEQADLKVVTCERLCEPSGKYTLRAFCNSL